MAVSIVIPLYNKEAYIKNTLSKVFRQTYQDFEVVIVDDGSTDSSASVVKEFDDPRIRLFSQENQGASAARNNGCRQARYEHIAFLDADDEWDEDYLLKMQQLIDRYPDAVLYGSNYYITESGETTVLSYPNVAEGMSVIEDFFVSSKVYTPVWTSAAIVKREAFLEENGFPLSCKVCEDIDLWCRLAARGQVAYINEPLANYRRDAANSLSRSTDTTMYFPFLDIYDKLISRTDVRYPSVCEYVTYKKVFAASFCLRNANKRDAKRIMQGIENPGNYKKKLLVYKILAHCPQTIIDGIYSLVINNKEK